MRNYGDITIKDKAANLRAVLLHRPDAHPLWHSYVVSLVHLRPLEGHPLNLAHPDSSHEIMIIALDPRVKNDPNDIKTLVYLSPPNLAYQLRGRTDEYALALFGAFVQALSTRGLNPDTDHRRHTTAWLERWEQGN